MKAKTLSKFRRISTLFSIISITVLLICIGGTTAFGDEPTIAVFAMPHSPMGNWDPAIESDTGTEAMNQVYETLFRYDFNEGKIVPVLATGFTKSSDGMSWTFFIREGVRFHDGSELDAEAVKFSISRTIKIGKGVSFIWAAVDKMTVLNKYTLKIDLKYPAALDLISTSAFGAFIVSPKAVQSHAEDWLSQGNAVGTGPYKLKSNLMEKEAVLEAYDDYWKGWGKKRYDFVIVKKIVETSSRRQMIVKGDATVAIRLPAEDVNQLKSEPNVTIETGPSQENLYLLFNTQKAPLNNKLIRQAFAYAFPYQKVVKYAASGYATQARGAIPVGLWGHSKSLFQYSENLEKAKQLLKQGNFFQKDQNLLYTYDSGQDKQKKTAELFKSNLAKIGVEVEIRGMPWESQWALSKSTKPEDRQDMMSMLWWPLYSDPYDFFYSVFHTEESIYYNMTYWYNNKFDKLVDSANEVSVSDRKKAIKMYHEAQEILIAENPAIFVFDKQNVTVIHKSLKGYKDNPAYPHTVFFHDTYPE
jgi:peptide/nickel transport system substrate-binding protein